MAEAVSPTTSEKPKAPRIGVFVCHCGTNIAGSIDIDGSEGVRQDPAERRARQRLQVPVLDARPEQYSGGDQGERPDRRRGRGLFAAPARADLPGGHEGRRPEPVPLRDGQHPRAELVGAHARPGGRDREGEGRRSGSRSRRPRSSRTSTRSPCPSSTRPWSWARAWQACRPRSTSRTPGSRPT